MTRDSVCRICVYFHWWLDPSKRKVRRPANFAQADLLCQSNSSTWSTNNHECRLCNWNPNWVLKVWLNGAWSWSPATMKQPTDSDEGRSPEWWQSDSAPCIQTTYLYSQYLGRRCPEIKIVRRPDPTNSTSIKLPSTCTRKRRSGRVMRRYWWTG